jgi:hypothetical protein
VSGGGDQRHPWAGRGWKGAETPLVIRGGGPDPLDRKGLEGGGAPSGDWRGRSKAPLGRKG